MKQHFPTRAAAAYCGVAVSTMQRWRHLGVGPRFIRISGRLCVYDKDELDRWLESRVVDPTERL